MAWYFRRRIKILPGILILLGLLGACVVCNVVAQTPSASQKAKIEVASFRLLETDLTANAPGTQVYSATNNLLCALIKIVTSEKGFTFDIGGAWSEQKAQNADHPAEIWLYVEPGARKIDIQHPKLGKLAERYSFPQQLQAGKTYEMKLTTGSVNTQVIEDYGKRNIVTFHVIPAHADLYIGGELKKRQSNGNYDLELAYGTYSYRVEADYYYETQNVFDVNDKTRSITIQLKQAFGWLSFENTAESSGAEVFIDEKSIGKLPIANYMLKSGSYKIKVKKPMFHDFTEQIVMNDSGKIRLIPRLKQAFGWLNLENTAESSGAEVFIDGKSIGKLPIANYTLKSGSYEIKVKKPLYHDFTEQIEIKDGGEIKITPKLKPNYATITFVVSHEETGAIWVDGEYKGEDKWTGRIEAGKHLIEVHKDNHRTTKRELIFGVGEEHTVLLEKPQPIFGSLKITSNPANADVWLDDKKVGTTPYQSGLILIGSHKVEVKNQSYQSEVANVVVQENLETVKDFTLSQYCNATIYTKPATSVRVGDMDWNDAPYKIHVPPGNYEIVAFAPNGYAHYRKTHYLDGNVEELHLKLRRKRESTQLREFDPLIDFYFPFAGLDISKIFLGYEMGMGLHIWGVNMDYICAFGEKIKMQAKVGYGFQTLSWLKITPQFGFSWGDIGEKGGGDKNVCFGLRFGMEYYMIGAYITPEYGIGVRGGLPYGFGGHIGLYFVADYHNL